MSTYFPKMSEIQAVFPDLVRLAQAEYDAWEQDEDGLDEELGTGGICHLIAEKFVDRLSRVGAAFGGPIVLTNSRTSEQHVNVLIVLDDGIYELDIPWSRYESGGGYSWTKLPNVSFDAHDIVVERLDYDLNNLHLFVEELDDDMKMDVQDFLENGNHIINDIDLIEVRKFLEEKWKEWRSTRNIPDEGAKNMCKFSSVFLQEILGDDWDVVGGYADPTEFDPDVINNMPGGFFDGKDYHGHMWIESGDALIDLTADQFGAASIIMTTYAASPQHIVNQVSELAELKENTQTSMKWAEEWSEIHPQEELLSTSEQIDEYLSGGCFTLALALHDQTGAPLMLLVDDSGIPHHAFVKSEYAYLDARGEISEKNIMMRNGTSVRRAYFPGSLTRRSRRDMR